MNVVVSDILDSIFIILLLYDRGYDGELNLMSIPTMIN
tara:strand:- start:518 stop:631 length:114 start_codon:yes stop_codon:yes gene_type:complete